MNATARKFGDPTTRIATCGAWTVLLRPHQPTLGALVLVCEEPVRAFGDVSAAGYADLARTTRRVEAMLGAVFAHDKINYLMLMMVDPDVHFHVLPRYAQVRHFAGQAFSDPAWPNAPDLGFDHAIDAATQAALIARLKEAWQ
jgi:diadenosine tetraphosphate (Ap4A) HIT family hydrolase